MPGTDRNFALLSTRRSAGEVEVSVGEVELPHPVDPDDVVARMLAASNNPSDIGSTLDPAEPGSARQTPAGAVLQVPEPSEVDPATLGVRQRLCLAERIGLVNIVRRPDQVELLRSLGADHVPDSSSRPWNKLPPRDDRGQEGLRLRQSRPQALKVERRFGFTWSIGGWLVVSFFKRLGPGRAAGLRRRAITMSAVTDPDTLRAVSRRATGEKYLLDLDEGNDDDRHVR